MKNILIVSSVVVLFGVLLLYRYLWFKDNGETDYRKDSNLEMVFQSNRDVFIAIENASMEKMRSNPRGVLAGSFKSEVIKIIDSQFRAESLTVYPNFLLIQVATDGWIGDGYYKGYAWIPSIVESDDGREWVRFSKGDNSNFRIKNLSGKWFIYEEYTP